MQNLYKTLGIAALVVVMFLIGNNEAEAAKRRVVVEDHTGAWCPWCTRGTQTLRELFEEYGEDFIPVQIHNTSPGRPDAMAIPEIQTVLAQRIGLTGYPSGSVNRIRWNNQFIATSDGNWRPLTQQIFNTPALANVWADVEVEYTISQSGMLNATVTVTADANVNGQFGINLFVLEDGVTGTGNGYNQQNALSNNPQFVGHPYYDKPSVIVDYVHDNVLRYFVGGIYGEDAPIAKTNIVAGDKFTQQFSQNISGRVYDLNKVWVVAAVNNLSQNNFEIVNAKMAGKEVPATARVSIAGDNDLYNRHDANQTITETLTVTNDNDFPVTVNLSTNTSISILPQGWTVNFSQNSLTIGANSQSTVDARLVTTGTMGFARINVVAEVQSTNDYQGKTSDMTFYSLSNSAKNAIYAGAGNGIIPLAQSFSTLGTIANQTVILPAEDAIINAYPLSGFELSVMNLDYNIRGALASSNIYSQAVIDALTNGKKVLLAGILESFFATGTVQGFTPASSAVSLFKNSFGIESFSLTSPLTISQRQQNGSINLMTVPVVANSSDPEFSGTSFTLNQYNQQSHPFYTEWVDRFRILNATTTKAFMYYTIQGVAQNESISGVQVQAENGAKAIVLGFSFDLIADANARGSFLAKSIDWLMKEAAPAPSMVLSTNNIEFGLVDVKTDRELKISNSGNAPLVLSQVSITNDADGVFSINQISNSTIQPGSELTVIVSYTPIQKATSVGTLRVESNAGNQSIALRGESSMSSVDNYLANTGLFVMSVNPNPVATQSSFVYELNTTGAENINLKIVDINGNVVENLFDGIQTPGQHTMTIDANKLANGKYFIIANLLGHNAKFPLVVTK
jgi:hypothetical protein